MKVVYHPDYNAVYSSDPASAPGKLRAIIDELQGKVTLVTPQAAPPKDILRVHSPEHIRSVERAGVYPMAALAAGGALRPNYYSVDFVALKQRFPLGNRP